MIRSAFFIPLLALFALPACAQVPDTPALPTPTVQAAPFSPVIVANNTIFLAGHLGRVPGTRNFPDGGIGPQTTQTLENIGATLATVNATHADLVRCQVFLADIADFAQMNAAYRKFFPQNPPARTTVAVSGLAANARIEIECTGIVGHAGAKTALAPRPTTGSHEKLRADTSASPDHSVIITDVVLAPEGSVSRHYHPTEEHFYVIDGSTFLREAGQPARLVEAGQSYTIASNTAHDANAGAEGLRAIVVRVHPKDQPERISANN